MHKRDKIRWRRTGFLQRIILLFFIGFFIGALFYYMFQKSFVDLMEQMTVNMKSWSLKNSLWYEYIKILWNHGKFFLLLWLLSVNKKVCYWFQSIFTLYTGLRNGFLLLFFIFFKGMGGVALYFASLFPHCLILTPLYLFSFYLINENRQREYKVGVLVVLFFLFLVACFIEMKCNLPMMERLL